MGFAHKIKGRIIFSMDLIKILNLNHSLYLYTFLAGWALGPHQVAAPTKVKY
jgi:hypothetical protein